MRISDWSSDVCSSDLFVLEARVADLAGTAAHQHDRLVHRLLKPAQQHDLYQAADMQRGRRRSEAEVARNDGSVSKRGQNARVGQRREDRKSRRLKSRE